MSTPVPTPAFVKKMVDQKKALEKSQELPSKKSSVSSASSKSSESPSKNGKNKPSSGTRNRSHSKFQKPTDTIASPSLEVTKDTSSIRKEAHEKSEGMKKVFVPKEHLTNQPLLGHSGLTALMTSLTPSSKPKSASKNQVRSRPARGTTSTTTHSESHVVRETLINKIEKQLDMQSSAKHVKKESN